MRVRLTLYLMLISVWSVSAQTAGNACDNALIQANKLYESGRIQEALNLLGPCVRHHDLSASEQFDATRLLALCYLYQNKSDSTEYFAKQMLTLRPDYQTFHYLDPLELTQVLNSFEVSNRLWVGASVGLSVTQAAVIKNYSTAETPSTYSSRSGLNAGILAEYAVRKTISLVLNPNYNSMSYAREMANVAGRKKAYTELISTFEIPLIARYKYPILGGEAYVQAGGQLNIWASSFADVQSTSLSDGTVHQSSTETTDYRVSSVAGFQFGLGYQRQVGPGLMSLTVKQLRFGSNVVLPERRYDNVDFILDAQYIDADFGLTSNGISVAFKMPLVKSIRKK
ncbi:MAG: outer membrane beta-barrel protein [Bacteroidetes bacterium]|nr:outer membrane beta-barrel protein [Bacteroidota bacterium]